MEQEKKKRLIIIDGNALIHRAYHALPPLATRKGELVNAVYGFLLVFFKALKEFQPDYVAATFDLPGPTFRHKEFKEYKAKRPKAPNELYQQIPKVKEILQAFNVPIFEKQGFEADDVIGTISGQAKTETIIITGDLDALQLINKNTKVFTPRRGLKDTVLYDQEKVEERYQGIKPEQLADLKGLKGDPSDNIPGILGIGEKTAISLIREFGSLENLYKELDEKTERAEKIKHSLREKLVKYRDQAFFSKMLVTIKRDVPIDFDLKDCEWEDFDKKKAIKILKDFEFYALIKRLSKGDRKDINNRNAKLF
ncbi:hypothetical protein AMJ49_03690 [Parcubacteria bacterium DG_74_2]|nr:MAG: hypothetical protein AMJ49_03690 [Parcubacteria bacterium DG_74_2]